MSQVKLRRDSGLLEQNVALGVAGRAAFEINAVCRDSVNIVVIQLNKTKHELP